MQISKAANGDNKKNASSHPIQTKLWLLADGDYFFLLWVGTMDKLGFYKKKKAAAKRCSFFDLMPDNLFPENFFQNTCNGFRVCGHYCLVHFLELL